MAALLGPLWWLWIVAPFMAAFVYVLAAKDDRRRQREIERWRKAFGPPTLAAGGGYREPAKPDVDANANPPKRAVSLPGVLGRALRDFGNGDVLAHFELVPKLAYLSVVAANAEQSSDFQAVVAKLEAKKGPGFWVKPIPIVEGVPQANTGIEFTKDPEFAELFVVEATTTDGTATTPGGPKAIRKWLSQPVRDALKELPEAWLHVGGGAMVLGYFGVAKKAELDQLVLAADTLFAEHGAGGGPSLFGEDDEDEPLEAPAVRAPKPA